jgi:DMSO/TMAO reductase YedYZ heme-binding membrane subunit
VCVALALGSFALFAAYGTDEPGVRVWIRATARASVALFLLAFTARPLRQLWRNAATQWLLRNRRGLGVSAAFAQLLHGISLAWLFVRFPSAEATPDATTLVLGGLGFAFYFAMALTSSDAAVAALGRRGWKLLHAVGGYWIWTIFAVTNGGNVPLAFEKLGLAHQLLYAGIQAALFGALALRAAAWLSARA